MDAPPPMTLRRIRRILDNSRDTAEREQAVESLLPFLWDRMPWTRYRTACILTTRVYLPYGLHPLELFSFPSVFLRRLRRSYRILPENPEARRAALWDILGTWLRDWSKAYMGQMSGKRPVMDIGADLCETVGRLGFYEGEEALLNLLRVFGRMGGNEARTALLIALAELPPARLTLLWEGLRTGPGGWGEQENLAATLAYMSNPDAVPFLLEILNVQLSPQSGALVRPLLKALGTIGDLRALPALNAIARDESHPERPTARLAIQRLMKQAEGHEEVSLLRASDLSTINRDVLLRASEGKEDRIRPEELLRPTSESTQEKGG